jgi:hypothetical protein
MAFDITTSAQDAQRIFQEKQAKKEEKKPEPHKASLPVVKNSTAPQQV